MVAVRDRGVTGYVAESLPRLGTVKAAPVGAEGGVGFEVRMLQHTFFAEARYMTISPGGVLPVTVGIRFPSPLRLINRLATRRADRSS